MRARAESLRMSDRISPRYSGLGQSYLPKKGDRVRHGRCDRASVACHDDGSGIRLRSLELCQDGDDRRLRLLDVHKLDRLTYKTLDS